MTVENINPWTGQVEYRYQYFNAGQVEAKLAARVCKRLAVKGGQTLTIEEQRALLNDLEACTSPRTCPHGRPTMIHLSVDTLEKQFGRKGPR